jgi:uncharacterized membrane protein
METLLGLDGLTFILRWLHFFFGIMWIGHLYYFNFTQGAFMAEADAQTKAGVLTKLLPKALWWFRWGAMWTFATGILMLLIEGHRAGSHAIYTSTSWGVLILIGSLLGITMWANVWFIIWPNQKIVIQSATQVAQGGAALPAAAGCAAKALLASRTNTMFSLPMLFFMGASRHLPVQITEQSNVNAAFGLTAIVWAICEINAIKGKLGPIQTVKGVITSGFVLTAVLYLILAFTL